MLRVFLVLFLAAFPNQYFYTNEILAIRLNYFTFTYTYTRVVNKRNILFLVLVMIQLVGDLAVGAEGAEAISAGGGHGEMRREVRVGDRWSLKAAGATVLGCPGRPQTARSSKP